jgi:hypothetical protein
MEIVFDVARGESQLVLVSGAVNGAGAAAESTRTTLATWLGDAGRFSYLDTDLTWHDTWPATSTSGPTVGFSALPLAVAFRFGTDTKISRTDTAGEAQSVVVAIQDRAPQPLRLKDLQ